MTHEKVENCIHHWQLTPEQGRFLGKCRKCQLVKFFPDWNRLKFSEKQNLSRKAKGGKV